MKTFWHYPTVDAQYFLHVLIPHLCICVCACMQTYLTRYHATSVGRTGCLPYPCVQYIPYAPLLLLHDIKLPLLPLSYLDNHHSTYSLQTTLARKSEFMYINKWIMEVWIYLWLVVLTAGLIHLVQSQVNRPFNISVRKWLIVILLTLLSSSLSATSIVQSEWDHCVGKWIPCCSYMDVWEMHKQCIYHHNTTTRSPHGIWRSLQEVHVDSLWNVLVYMDWSHKFVLHQLEFADVGLILAYKSMVCLCVCVNVLFVAGICGNFKSVWNLLDAVEQGGVRL